MLGRLYNSPEYGMSIDLGKMALEDMALAIALFGEWPMTPIAATSEVPDPERSKLDSPRWI